MILLCAFTFSYQSVSAVQTHSYKIDSTSVSVSSDFSEVAYIVLGSSNPYLVVRSIQYNNYKLYDLSHLPCTTNIKNVNCFPFTNSLGYSLTFYKEQNVILIKQPYFLDSNYTSTFSLNLQTGSLFDLLTTHYQPIPIVINSNFYYEDFTNYVNGSVIISIYNNDSLPLHEILVNADVKLFPNYIFSPDFSKLVVMSSSVDVNLTGNIYFFTMNNYTLSRSYNETYPVTNSFFTSNFHFVKWINNNNLLYSYCNGFNTTLYSFDYSNLNVSTIFTMPLSNPTITGLSSDKSYITLKGSGIYPIPNPTLKTYYVSKVQDSYWDSTVTHFIGVSQSEIMLMKYNVTLNSVKRIEILDKNSNEINVSIFKSLTVFFFLGILITIPITFLSLEKWKL